MANVVGIPFISVLIISIFVWHAEGNGGYSYTDCTYVQGDYSSTTYGGRCFCYTSAAVKWKDFWSTFQVRVTSKDDVFIVYPMEARNCKDSGNLLARATCVMESYWPFGVQKEKTLDVPLVGEEVFFMTKSPKASVQYKLHISQQRFNKMRFSLFACGLALFFFARAVCRSSLFSCILGVSLGMASILVFLLLALKSFVPSRLLFLVLAAAAFSLSYLGVHEVVNNWDDVMTLYWRELLGYLFISGFISLTVCYKLGPITNKRTLTLLTWIVQAVGIAVACHGVTYAPVSWKLLAVLLGLKVVPVAYAVLLGIWRQTRHLLSAFLGLFRGRRKRRLHPKTRLLTEEEYREQAERQTKASLEELRKYCNSPGFPAWDTVLRLRSPQRFAGFLRGGGHVTPSEQQNHEERGRLAAESDDNNDDTFLDSTRMSEDFSEDEANSYKHHPPTPSPAPLPYLPAIPDPPAQPQPPGFVGPLCPYPASTYPPSPYPPSLPVPAPAPPFSEDDDEPF